MKRQGRYGAKRSDKPQFNMVLYQEDVELLTDLSADLAPFSRADVVRLALRELARLRGVRERT